MSKYRKKPVVIEAVQYGLREYEPVVESDPPGGEAEGEA